MEIEEVPFSLEKTILIIDDSATVRRYLRSLFEGGFPGTRLAEASDGRTALREMTRIRADLIVTDLNMPGMDGENFIAKLRSNPLLKRKSVLVLSGEDMSGLRAFYAEDGGIRFLTKPSGANEILGTARALLGSHNTTHAS